MPMDPFPYTQQSEKTNMLQLHSSVNESENELHRTVCFVVENIEIHKNYGGFGRKGMIRIIQESITTRLGSIKQQEKLAFMRVIYVKLL